jgi:TP901 family phage tail tape measure protein
MKNSTEAMRKQVEELAFSIGRNYGIAATETAALAADIAATGAEGEKLIKSVQETTRLAVLGEVDGQEAMKATLAIQSAFKMDTDELTESINFLNAVENQTSTTLQDFATAIPRVGPVVQSLGGDIQDLAMMLVAMREGGVPAAEAANAIKSGLASMINPTQKASDVAKEFGINLNKIVEDNKGQLMPTIYAMQNALQGLDDFGRARIIEEIFGKYQFARMSALFENLGRMGSQTQSVLELTANSSVELAAIANAELKTLQESTAMKFQRTLEQLRNTLIPIGETLTESLIPIFEFIGQAAGKFIEFFQALPEPVKNFAKYGTAIAALAGPVIMLVGLFGNLIANGIKFGMMMVRLGARIAGLRVEKFELLNEEVMAARLGVDTLTGSFTTQEKALRQLIGAMSSYGASLRTLQNTNPALFIPGAGRPPIKRASGSSSPEFVPGSGRGDKIPAMLEPGEFVVNRSATEKYAPVLMQMNRGNLPGFQNGTDSPVNFGKGRYSAPTSVASKSPVGEGMARGHIFGTGREAKSLKISGDYFLWHKNFWLEISQEENQLMNILQLSAKKNQPLFQKTLQEMNVDQAMTERIMAKIRSGVMLSEDEARTAHAAIRKLATQIEQGQIPASQMTAALGKYVSSVAKLPQLTSLTLDKIRAAETQLISGITAISTTSGPEAQRARALLAEKLVLVRGLIEQVGAAPVTISAEIAKILQMASPSRVFEQIGRNTADGGWWC